MTDPTNATRQAKHRARGRPVSFTLTDPEAIQKLDTLATKLGGIKKAIEHALKETDKWPDNQPTTARKTTS